jgi:hypothetical protein
VFHIDFYAPQASLPCRTRRGDDSTVRNLAALGGKMIPIDFFIKSIDFAMFPVCFSKIPVDFFVFQVLSAA